MNCRDANAIPIDQFLAARGIEPVKTRAHSKWYLSPLRTERTASFKVNTNLNTWYDFGIGVGGDLVNLGIRLTNTTVREFLLQLGSGDLHIIDPTPTRNIEIISEWNITKVKAISHPALLSYLKQRSIPLSLANTFCAQVHYTNGKQEYFAIAIRNDSDGYEVRNNFFKGSIGKKDITTLHKDPTRIALFEGFIDFLSAHELFDPVRKSSAIILNSVTQLPKALHRLEAINPQKIETYFDNDETGKKCTQDLRAKFPDALDKTHMVVPYKDVNDLLRYNKSLNIQI